MSSRAIRFALAPLALLALPVAGCATIAAVPDAPQAQRGYPEGSAVALGQPVQTGSVVVTPMKVLEDSRCPINARCVWAGRLIVETRIDGAGWRDTAPVTLGETYGTHGAVIALVASAPDKTTQVPLKPGDYRFTYEAR